MTTRHSGAVALATLLATVAVPALAQSLPPFVVERPSFSTPPEVVGRGYWQIETGVGWDHEAPEDADGVTTLSAPNVIIRVGVNRRLELRASAIGLLSVDGPRTRTTAPTDVEVGVKYQLAAQSGVGLDLSVVPMVSLPTGGTGVSSGNADPSAILTVARSLGVANLNGNLKWSAPSVGSGANERAQALDWSLVLAHPLWGRWSAFWEGVANDVDTKGVETAWVANAGLGRLFGETLLVDVYGGVGLNDAAPNWRVGAGFGWRFTR